MLESLHAGEPAGVLPTGFVVANDNDSSRAYMLAHQCARIGLRTLLVTCHDAQQFPSFYRHSLARGEPDTGFFDRILADVPCSGDGTARKNGDVFSKWGPGAGLGLHPLQLLIAMRGLQVRLGLGGQ